MLSKHILRFSPTVKRTETKKLKQEAEKHKNELKKRFWMVLDMSLCIGIVGAAGGLVGAVLAKADATEEAAMPKPKAKP